MQSEYCINYSETKWMQITGLIQINNKEVNSDNKIYSWLLWLPRVPALSQIIRLTKEIHVDEHCEI